MRCERFAASLEPGAVVERLRALVPTSSSVSEATREIIEEVRRGGDEAVLAYTRRFDTSGSGPKPLRVEGDALDAAAGALDAAVRHGLERAIENVRKVAAGGSSMREVDFGTHTVRVREVPVARAAVYVPGGRAPYPSTVVMGVVPALVAGVREIAVCAPPGRDGEIPAVVLAACRLVGATTVYRMGGAQAIAALAYGTESVTPVDVIVGPGNNYVQEAKRQVFGQVGVDGFAGPSDLMLIADEGSDAEPLGLDLLAQAEHGPGSLVVGVSTSAQMLSALAERLGRAPDTGAAAGLVQVSDHRRALALAQAFAPEHLELVGPGAEGLAGEASTAGCVFVGAGSATAFGDYIAGSNHILPTAGAGRFASALSPEHFRRHVTQVAVRDPNELARDAAPVARAEAFELHAQSMEARIRQNRA